MRDCFFLIWQDADSRRWFPVGKLVREADFFFFMYTRGASAAPNFTAFGNMTDFDVLYVSRELFPIFQNRLFNEKRPEYRKYLRWSALDNGLKNDPLALMARMGGTRATDTLQVYPMPEKNDAGKYQTTFFSHGLGYMPEASREALFKISVGSKLYCMWDAQNTYDTNAIALRTADPAHIAGYCPRHLAPDILHLFRAAIDSLSVTVVKFNNDAPNQYKLLCRAESVWPDGFRPCSGDEYQPLIDFQHVVDRMRGSLKLPTT